MSSHQFTSCCLLVLSFGGLGIYCPTPSVQSIIIRFIPNTTLGCGYIAASNKFPVLFRLLDNCASRGEIKSNTLYSLFILFS
ncbi:hypothetical protein QBC42DRAFT_276765 [Cladorrhinum samala]|uniref:Secreted protein n=1 Tax=Cladorrhinum samala TaxID=585594 RepID=A0AAV9HED6_9PEZI|nr:hypothetical protein QBC42DRAFT_276765 [Cladorrhinum samala]